MSYGIPAVVTETGTAVASRCQVKSVAAGSDGLAATAKLYNGEDNYDAGDPPLITVSSDGYQWVSGSGGMMFSEGVYVVFTGSGTCTIEYDQGL